MTIHDHRQDTMAAWGGTAEDTGNGTASRPRSAVLRLLTAALAGGAVLLLWGGTAGARAADTSSGPAPSASSDGLLNGLVGEGGALTPVVDLVDGVTQPLTGAKPVGSTVSTVVTTVDPIVAPVVDPVAPVTDPVVTPVLDTVHDVTEGVTTTLTDPVATPTVPGAPGTPTTPTGPVVPPVTGPGATPLPELPSLLPPDPTTDPGATPGSGSTPTVDPSVVGSGAPLPLALAADPDGAAESRTGSAALAADRSATAGTASAEATAAAARATGPAHGFHGAGHDAVPGSHRGHGPFAPVAPVPAPCAGGSLGGAGSSLVPAPAWLDTGALSRAAAAAHTISVPSASEPGPAPCAGPDVSPD